MCDGLRHKIVPEAGPGFPDTRRGAAHPPVIRWDSATMGDARQQKVEGSAATSRRSVRRRRFTRSGSPLLPRQGRRPPAPVFYRVRRNRHLRTPFLEGRLSDAQLDTFRQRREPRAGRRTRIRAHFPDFWEFPTVSMGIGPLNAI